MKKILTFILTLHCSLFTVHCYAQNRHLIDSLTTKLNQLELERKELRHDAFTLYDSAAANVLNDIAKAYRKGNPEDQLKYAKQCLALSEKIGYKKGIGSGYHEMGYYYYVKDSVVPSLFYDQKALSVWKEINYEKGMSASFNNMGIDYMTLDNLAEALKCYLASLKISERLKAKQIIASAEHNISVIYRSTGNYKLAIEYLLRAKKINEELGNLDFLSRNLGTLADIYAGQKKYDEAYKTFFEAIKVGKESGNDRNLIATYTNVSELYMEQGNDVEALKYIYWGIEIAEKDNDKNNLVALNINLAKEFEKKNNLAEALKYADKAIDYANTLDIKSRSVDAYQYRASIRFKLHNFEGAYKDKAKYEELKDSVDSENNIAKIKQLEMQNEFNKMQDASKAEQTRKDLEKEKELQKQKLVRNSFVAGFAVVLLFAGIFFKQRNKIGKEKKISEELLLNILPAEVAEELKLSGEAEAKQFDDVTVLFTDFVGFTLISEKLTPKELVAEIHTYFTAFDKIMEKHGLEKIKTIGDAYLAICGLPHPTKDHAKRTVEAAIDIIEFIKHHETQGGKFNIRVGINSGSVVAGIVGVKKFAYDIWGDTVNTAARMEQNSKNGKINISESTYQLVKNDFKCEHRGKIAAKNKGEVDMYFVESGIKN